MASRRLEVVIAGDASSAVRSLGQTERAVGGFDRTSSRAAGRFSSTWKSGISSVGRSIGGLVAGAGLARFFQGAVAEAEEAAQVMRQTNSVIESTGGVAGVTAGHLSDLAGELSALAGIDDELVQSGGNVLLTFKNIKAEGGIFDDALASATDLAAHPMLGGDMAAAARMVGRALNDPLKGVTALTRAGVQLSDSQKAQIEQMMAYGNIAGAQRVILGELETQLGGTAEANATASARMTVAWDNIKESIGTALLPVLDQAATKLTELAEWFTAMPSSVQAVTAGVIGLTVAFAALYAVMGGPVTIAVAALAVTGATIYGVWLVTQPLRDLFFEVVGLLQQWWQNAQPVRDVMIQIGTQVLSGLRTAVQWLVTAFGVWWAAAAPVRGILNVIGSIGLFALRTAVSNVIALVRTAWMVSTPLRAVLAFIGGIAMGALRGAISDATSKVRAAWSASLPLRSMLTVIGGMTLSALRSAADAVASAFSRIGSTLDSVASKIRNLPTPSSLLSRLPGFASGTVSAPRGLGWVGERGPELVRFNGGERVYPAGRSAAMAGRSGGGGVSIVVQVYGDASATQADKVIDALRQWTRTNGPVPIRVNG